MICIMVYSQEYFTPLFQFWGMTCLRMIIKVTPVAKIIKEVNTIILTSYCKTQNRLTTFRMAQTITVDNARSTPFIDLVF